MEIQKLEGYQSKNKELQGKGVTVTFQGDTFNVLNLKPEDVNPYNIATSLSRLARYMGHTGEFYSVAQHAVRGAEALLLMGRPKLAYTFLHHDDAEAFMSDFSSPLKKVLGDKLSEIEEQIERVIADKLNLIYPFPEEVELIDKNLAQEEMTLLMKSVDRHNFDYWDPEKAEKMYIFEERRLTEMMMTTYKDVRTQDNND